METKYGTNAWALVKLNDWQRRAKKTAQNGSSVDMYITAYPEQPGTFGSLWVERWPAWCLYVG